MDQAADLRGCAEIVRLLATGFLFKRSMLCRRLSPSLNSSVQYFRNSSVFLCCLFLRRSASRLPPLYWATIAETVTQSFRSPRRALACLILATTASSEDPYNG